MNGTTELKSLTEIFNNQFYRIPDYQRGYAWQKIQLIDFWEDIINLSDAKHHYTGMLTLKQINDADIPEEHEDKWLSKTGHKAFYVIDGQQRLTTFIILLFCIIEKIRKENQGKNDSEIILNNEELSEIIKRFIFRTKAGDVIKTYKFGYTTDNPSYHFLKNRILNSNSAGMIEETFYTLNLENSKKFFTDQLEIIFNKEGIKSIESIYIKLTQKLLFNIYIISDDFNVFVAFETMNNRGKKLSHLELLKNRLIYLTTLYPEKKTEKDDKAILRSEINDAWKEIYFELGRNKRNPLNDDDFLRAHWILYFQYKRQKGSDYITFLLNEYFTPKNIFDKVEIKINFEEPSEIIEEFENENDEPNNISTSHESKLQPTDIKAYTYSIKSAAFHWFNIFNPYLATTLTLEEKIWLDKINRIGITYFRPLIVSSFLNTDVTVENRIKLFKAIERFIFIAFRLWQARSNYGDSEFYNTARELYYKRISIDEIISRLNERIKSAFDSNNFFKIDSFKTYIDYKFNVSKTGYYGWAAIYYFLYEYELMLMKDRGQKKIDWDLFVKTEKDKITIEHILPQDCSDPYWKKRFGKFKGDKLLRLTNSLGNLLPLSGSINSSLQNDSFDDKKNIKKDSCGSILRNGYKNGSYSEIEVSQYDDWTPETIKRRGLILLNFLENRWNIKIGDEEIKTSILGIDFIK